MHERGQREGSGEPAMVVHGLDVSYFTGKLEGYLRLKGLPYRLEHMDTARFKALGRQTGVRQMPHLSLPDGRLLTDTVAIIDTLERECASAEGSPLLTPRDPFTAFLAQLIEAFADEHLWRPALYYRWGLDDDARLLSSRLAQTLLRDVAAPFWLKRVYILHRQRWFYLRGEGSERAQGPVIEADYRAVLDALEQVFTQRDWLLGDAPTRADVGLFGPVFRHFLSDPTPVRILRERAPATAAWAARVWASGERRPVCGSGLTIGASPLVDLAPLMRIIAEAFLPEAAANRAACVDRRRRVRWSHGGTTFQYRANPYRAWRLARLSGQYAGLSAADRDRVAEVLGPEASAILATSAQGTLPHIDATFVRDRWWRPA